MRERGLAALDMSNCKEKETPRAERATRTGQPLDRLIDKDRAMDALGKWPSRFARAARARLKKDCTFLVDWNKR